MAARKHSIRAREQLLKNLERGRERRLFELEGERVRIKAAVLDAHARGEAPVAIAARLGVAPQRIYDILKSAGRSRPRPTDEIAALRARCAALAEAGVAAVEIARRLGRSATWVYETLAARGLRERRASDPRQPAPPIGDDEALKFWKSGASAEAAHLADLRSAYPGLALTSYVNPDVHSYRVSHVFSLVFSASPFATVAELGEGA